MKASVKTTMKKKTRNYALSILLIVVLTLFALWYTLKDDKEAVFEVLKSISPISFIAILGCSLLYYIFIALSIFVIAREKYPHYRFISALSNAYIGGFFSGVTPSASGGQAGQIYVFHKQGVHSSDAAGILWMDFVMYQVVLIFYTLILVLLKFPVFSGRIPALFTMIFIGFCMNGVVLLMLFSMAFFPKTFKKVCLKIVHLLHKMHLLRDQKKALKKFDDYLEAFTVNINKNRSNKKLIWKLIVINIARLTAYYSIPFLIGMLIHVKMDFIDSLALSSYVSMANAFFPVPGASGGTEMMFYQLYSMIMQPAYVSTILILWRVVTFHLSLMIGGVMFIYEKLKRRVRI